MPKRTICIQNPAALSVAHNSLVVNPREGGSAVIPLEDIWVIVIESLHVEITSSALSAIADAGIGVMTCGRDHMPNGLHLPIAAHSRHAAIVDDQLSMSKPLTKRLWQRIVISKISNQAKAMELLGHDPTPVMKYAAQVASGDTTNRESVAAAAYFKRILPEGSRRNGTFAAPLDYGYGVLRAGVGRSAVAGGWLVSRGIHHDSNLNAFNLVDDLIEPFRPFVDLLVVTEDLGGELDHSKKARLASIFEYMVKVDGKMVSLQTAIDLELASLRTAVLSNDARTLVLPSVIPPVKHCNE